MIRGIAHHSIEGAPEDFVELQKSMSEISGTRSPANRSSTKSSIEDARVPAENLIGELNGGWSVLQTALVYERRFMADIARTARDAKRPRAEKANLLVELGAGSRAAG